MQRRISILWLQKTLLQPQLQHVDSDDPNVIHAFRIIPEYGDRVLHVVYDVSVVPKRVISAYFDRRYKGKI